MKLVTFEVPTPVGPFERLGALTAQGLVDLNFAYAALRSQRLADVFVPAEMLAFLDGGEDSLDGARQALTSIVRKGPKTAGPRGQRIVYKENEVKLLPPLKPRALRDFFAYEDHALQGAKRRREVLAPEWYAQPVYYKGNPRELYGPGAVIPWPSYTRRLDFELEIACVVGKKGRDLSPAQAGAHIAGYTIFNDLSARDIQKNEMVCRMGPAKGKDFGNVLGPYLLTADELKKDEQLAMSVWVNGKRWSSGTTRDRYWSFAEMLSHVSQSEWVYPGDVLGSGTYFKGCGLDMDRWLKPGDRLELKVEKLGVLRSIVGAPKAQKQIKYDR